MEVVVEEEEPRQGGDCGATSSTLPCLCQVSKVGHKCVHSYVLPAAHQPWPGTRRALGTASPCYWGAPQLSGIMMKKPDLKVVLLGDMNVGKTSLLHRYMERRFQDTVSTVGGAFYLKQWGPYNISIWDTAGREQFHGLGSMYCRSASAILLTYDVCNMQSLMELEDRFLGLTDTASDDCIFAIVGNKLDLTDDYEAEGESDGEKLRRGSASKLRKQVHNEDAVALYKRIMKYRMVDEAHAPDADKMCFETSAKTGYNVDFLFESLFNMVVPLIVKKKANGPDDTVILAQNNHEKKTKSGCC